MPDVHRCDGSPYEIYFLKLAYIYLLGQNYVKSILTQLGHGPARPRHDPARPRVDLTRPSQHKLGMTVQDLDMVQQDLSITQHEKSMT